MSAFQLLTLLTKAFGIIFLLAMSYVNAHGQFIGREPQKFMTESLLVGGLTAIAFGTIALSRGQGVTGALGTAITALLVFFVFNVVMEMSGFNQHLAEPEKLSEHEKANIKKVDTPFKAVMFVIVFVGAVLAVYTWDRSNVTIPKLVGEASLVGLMNAGPAIYIGINRSEDPTKPTDKEKKKIMDDAVLFFMLFFVLHVGLQLGGFYTQIFKPVEAVEAPAEAVEAPAEAPANNTPANNK
jgi:hypothetical protein